MLSVVDGNVYMLTAANDEIVARLREVVKKSPYADVPLSPIRGTGQCFFVYERDGRILGYVAVTMVPYVDSLIVDRTLDARQRAFVLGRLLKTVEKYVKASVQLMRAQFQQWVERLGIAGDQYGVLMPSLVAHVWKGDSEWFHTVMTREKRDGWEVYPDHVLVVKQLEDV